MIFLASAQRFRRLPSLNPASWSRHRKDKAGGRVLGAERRESRHTLEGSVWPFAFGRPLSSFPLCLPSPHGLSGIRTLEVSQAPRSSRPGASGTRVWRVRSTCRFGSHSSFPAPRPAHPPRPGWGGPVPLTPWGGSCSPGEGPSAQHSSLPIPAGATSPLAPPVDAGGEQHQWDLSPGASEHAEASPPGPSRRAADMAPTVNIDLAERETEGAGAPAGHAEPATEDGPLYLWK